MAVAAKYAAYDKDGNRCGGGSLSLPEHLDWMHIDVKAEYFRFIGQGPNNAYYLILESQGQEKLIPDVDLRQITYQEYKGKEALALGHVDKFITEGGYTREPRNQ